MSTDRRSGWQEVRCARSRKSKTGPAACARIVQVQAVLRNPQIYDPLKNTIPPEVVASVRLGFGELEAMQIFS